MGSAVAEQLYRLRAALSTRYDLDLDYAYQDFEAFGAVHRIGLRWTHRSR